MLNFNQLCKFTILMKIIIHVLLTFILSNLQAQNWQYLSQISPKNELIIFAPNIISTELNERDFAISPDDKEIYYSVVSGRNKSVIMVIQFFNKKWQSPKIASFSSSQFYDIEPAFSHDGKRLFFSSNRQSNSGGVKDADIWVVNRKANGEWSEPENVGSPVNTTGDEYFPSISKNGTLYWTGQYQNGIGGEDIWFAKFINGVFQKP
jgi:Tol biopolymer transport system component